MIKPNSIRLPAEWAPHEATLLTWPHNPTDWPGRLTAVRSTYIEFIRILARFEKVWILSKEPPEKSGILPALVEMRANLSNISILHIPTNRSWIRDYGPITVVNGEGKRIFKDFTFNGWARFPAHQLDQAVSAGLSKNMNLGHSPVTYAGKPVVLEGGSIDSNGEGALLTTRECLLSDSRQKRNPDLDQEDLELIFKEHLGIWKTIWLNKGIEGDDTHGHVDDIARFVSPTTLVAMIESNREDSNYSPLQENLETLKGTGITTLPLHMPAPLWHKGHRLPASYANFYIGNGCVIVPTFNDEQDRNALGLISECFPDRKIIGLHGVDLLTGLGGPHCVSMQIPSEPKN